MNGYSDEKDVPNVTENSVGVRSRKVWNRRWWVHVRYRRIVRPFMSWNDTTPAPTVAGT